jgi:hypothetical protein
MMYRKILHIVLSIFILIATSGVSVNMHYCQNKLVSMQIGYKTKACCGNKSCCHTDTKYVRVDDKTTLINSFSFDHSKIITLIHHFPVIINTHILFPLISDGIITSIAYSPPGTMAKLSNFCSFLL